MALITDLPLSNTIADTDYFVKDTGSATQKTAATAITDYVGGKIIKVEAGNYQVTTGYFIAGIQGVNEHSVVVPQLEYASGVTPVACTFWVTPRTVANGGTVVYVRFATGNPPDGTVLKVSFICIV